MKHEDAFDSSFPERWQEMKQPVRLDETPILQKILDRLMSIDPLIKRLEVEPPDPAMAVFLLELSDVCYITTKADAGREETALITSDGKTYYTTRSLADIERKLADNPHFLKTSKFYIVNLKKIRGMKINNARDLWFEGIEKPLLNGVTATYLEEFEKRLL